MASALDVMGMILEDVRLGRRHDADIEARAMHYERLLADLEAISAKRGRNLTIGEIEE